MSLCPRPESMLTVRPDTIIAGTIHNTSPRHRRVALANNSYYCLHARSELKLILVFNITKLIMVTHAGNFGRDRDRTG